MRFQIYDLAQSNLHRMRKGSGVQGQSPWSASADRSVKKTCQWQVFSVGHACFTGMVRWFLLICKGEFSAPLKRGETLAGGFPSDTLHLPQKPQPPPNPKNGRTSMRFAHSLSPIPKQLLFLRCAPIHLPEPDHNKYDTQDGQQTQGQVEHILIGIGIASAIQLQFPGLDIIAEQKSQKFQ